MSTEYKDLNSHSKLERLFRSFEIITEYRELIIHSKDGFIRRLPRIISLYAEFQFLPYYFSAVPKWRLFARGLNSRHRIVPDYVMTGPIKCGSSDLVSHLLLHPNIMPPLAKEIQQLRPKNWRAYYPTEREKQALEGIVKGPVRCGYLEPFLNNMPLMNKLYRLNPQSKIIITLRDPVFRFYSQWKWELFLGGEQLKENPYFSSFQNYTERAIDLFPSIAMETLCGFPALETGIYYKAVEKWIEKFGRKNVLIFDSSEYFLNRQPTLEKVQKFLELPVMEIPEYDKKANENPIKLPPASAETKAILAEFYKPYNQKLFKLVDTEFDWL